MKSINKNIYFFISITALIMFFSACEQKKEINKNSVDKPNPNTHTLKAPEGMVGILPPPEGIIGRGTDYEMPDPNKYFWYGGVFIENRRNVKISPYAVAKYEVTYKLWKEVYDWAIKNGYGFANSGQKGGIFNKPYDADKHNNNEPVTMVSWYDCIVWCNAYTHKKNGSNSECVYRKSKYDQEILTHVLTKEGSLACAAAFADMSKKGFRLPTEAEWEYAARFQGENSTNAVKHGSIYLTKLNSASGAADNWLNAQEMNEAAWYFIEGTERVTHPVGLKKANFLGLYDMSGNVSEWCFDFYEDDPTKNDEQYAENEFIVNPQGAAVSDARVIRGGSGNDYAKNCCVGYKDPLQAEEKISYLGFRIVCTLDPVQ